MVFFFLFSFRLASFSSSPSASAVDVSYWAVESVCVGFCLRFLSLDETSVVAVARRHDRVLQFCQISSPFACCDQHRCLCFDGCSFWSFEAKFNTARLVDGVWLDLPNMTKFDATHGALAEIKSDIAVLRIEIIIAQAPRHPNWSPQPTKPRAIVSKQDAELADGCKPL